MTIPETATTPEIPTRRERVEAIARIKRALFDIAPMRTDTREMERMAHDVADECVEAFLIAADGGVK